MSTAILSSKFQLVIPKEVRKKLHLMPHQQFLVVEKGNLITLIPQVTIKSLKGFLKGISTKHIREKKDRF